MDLKMKDERSDTSVVKSRTATQLSGVARRRAAFLVHSPLLALSGATLTVSTELKISIHIRGLHLLCSNSRAFSYGIKIQFLASTFLIGVEESLQAQASRLTLDCDSNSVTDDGIQSYSACAANRQQTQNLQTTVQQMRRRTQDIVHHAKAFASFVVPFSCLSTFLSARAEF